jgi:hypothetical protein
MAERCQHLFADRAARMPAQDQRVAIGVFMSERCGGRQRSL